MSKATFYEHFANKEDCILALFDAATTSCSRRCATPARSTRRGPAPPHPRRRRGLPPRARRLPDEAQTLLVEIIGAGPRAMERRDRALAARRLHRRDQPPTPSAATCRAWPRRTTRSRSSARSWSSRRASCGPASPATSARSSRSSSGWFSGCCTPVVPVRVARAALEAAVVECRRCPRLVEWREQVAREKRAAFRDEDVLGPPVPGFGDPARARAAPRARARRPRRQPHRPRVHRRPLGRLPVRRRCTAPGFANQPESVRARRRARAARCFMTAAVRCAPPANKPLPAERDNCARLARARAGAAGRACASCSASAGSPGTRRCGCARLGDGPRPRPRFGHGAEVRRPAPWTLLGCFHPSQQNTFTGRLTPPMLDAVLERARSRWPREALPRGPGRAARRRLVVSMLLARLPVGSTRWRSSSTCASRRARSRSRAPSPDRSRRRRSRRAGEGRAWTGRARGACCSRRGRAGVRAGRARAVHRARRPARGPAPLRIRRGRRQPADLLDPALGVALAARRSAGPAPGRLRARHDDHRGGPHHRSADRRA